MVLRSEFLISSGAAAFVAALPISARGQSDGYSVDSEYAVPNFGTVRTIAFAQSGERVAHCTFAAMQRARTFAVLEARPTPDRNFLEIRKAALDRNATIAVNAAYSTADNYADGLIVHDMRVLHFADPAISGALAIDAFGKLSIVRTADLGIPSSAVQGDLLIDPHDRSAGIHASASSATRTFVALAGETVVAGTTSNLTHRQLANLLNDSPAAFGVAHFNAAICLGGDAPSAFFAHLNATTDVDINAHALTPEVLLFQAK